ncbi:chorismate-binding protein [Naumannella sp. ID2617S]|nr:chorismate-binding protein [Naumannella sp. ID2617S]
MTVPHQVSPPRSARRPPLRARTISIADPGDLAALLPGETDLAWIRRGDGLVATGVVERQEFDCIADADEWWGAYASQIEHESELPGLSGTGPVAFGSFTFDADHTASRAVLLVPQFVVGRRDGLCWLTRVGEGPMPEPGWAPKPQRPPTSPGLIRYSDGAMSGPAWESVVSEAVRRIRAGEVDKVVLARDLLAQAERAIDPRWLVTRLARDYQRCWTYLVDDLVGASPEMLVRRQDGLVTSRVLAGTIQRTSDAAEDRALAAHLSHSSKDLSEHEYAVTSVARALAAYCSGMNVPDAPYVLELPNVFHLATDVTAVARPGASSLALAAALHPTAAVCGTPTGTARQLIREIEGLDRGRYSGPVGWVDAQGDGEWAIALRCGRLDGANAQLYAGCGIVADSDPEAELAESMAKLVPMRDALEG